MELVSKGTDKWILLAALRKPGFDGRALVYELLVFVGNSMIRTWMRYPGRPIIRAALSTAQHDGVRLDPIFFDSESDARIAAAEHELSAERMVGKIEYIIEKA